MASQVDTGPASIQANRFGQCTSGQQKRLEAELGGVVGSVLVICLFGLVPLGLTAFILGWSLARVQVGGVPIGLILVASLASLVAGLFCWLASRPVIARARLRRDLSAGLIAQAEGEVTFAGGAYRARANGRFLRPIAGSREVDLAPGRYRLYFLPLAGLLLSAEALAPLVVQPHAEVLDALMQANQFDLSDLATNRQGQLSTRQLRRIRRGLMILLVVALVPLGLLALDVISRSSTLLWSGPILGVILAVIAFVAYGGAIELPGRRVAWLEGVVTRVEDTSGEFTTYYYELAARRFLVTHTAYAALVESLRYRLYYAPRTKRLLSIELLS